MIVCLLLITLAGSFTRCTAMKNGAPEEACSNLVPKHVSFKPQQDKAPYSISTQSLGDKISVIISSPAGASFKGFILQARSASNRNKFIPGEFKISDIAKGVNCEGLEQGTLTHVNNDPKAQVLTEWNGSTDEDIIFRATVVKDYATFWTNIDSDPVSVEKRETEEKPVSSMTHDCVESEYCFGLPEMCMEHGDCKVLLKIKPDPSGIAEFSLRGQLEDYEYMAVGISKDNIMGEDFVTGCLRVGPTGVKLQKSWNKGKSNVDAEDVSQNSQLTILDGETLCAWHEPKVLDFKGKTFDLTSKPYILLANGNVTEEGLGYHYGNKLSSSEPIDIFHMESVDRNEDGDKQMTEEPDVKQTAKPTSHNELVNEANSCLQLNLNLCWFSLFAVFFARGRNLI